MFKVMKKLSPSIINEIFGNIVATSNRSGNIFLRENANSAYNGENSIRIFGPIVWNTMLPMKYKSITSLYDSKHGFQKIAHAGCVKITYQT